MRGRRGQRDPCRDELVGVVSVAVAKDAALAEAACKYGATRETDNRMIAAGHGDLDHAALIAAIDPDAI